MDPSPLVDHSHRSQLIERPVINIAQDDDSIYGAAPFVADSTDSSVGVTRMALGPKGIGQIDPKSEPHGRKRKPEPGRVGSDDSFEAAEDVEQNNPTSNNNFTGMSEVPEQMRTMFTSMMNRFVSEQHGSHQYVPGQGQPWQPRPNMDRPAAKPA